MPFLPALWAPLLALVFLLYTADDTLDHEHEAALLARIVEYPAPQCPAPPPVTPALVPDPLAEGVAFLRKVTALGRPENKTVAERYRGIAHASLLRAKDDLLWAENQLAAHRAGTPLPGPCRGCVGPPHGDDARIRKALELDAVFDLNKVRKEDIALWDGPPYVRAHNQHAVRASMCRTSLADAQQLVNEKSEAHRAASARFLLYEDRLVPDRRTLFPQDPRYMNIEQLFNARARNRFAEGVLLVVDMGGTGIEIKAAGREVVRAWRDVDRVLTHAMWKCAAHRIPVGHQVDEGVPVGNSASYIPFDLDDAVSLMNQARVAYKRAKVHELAYHKALKTGVAPDSLARTVARAHDIYVCNRQRVVKLEVSAFEPDTAPSEGPLSDAEPGDSFRLEGAAVEAAVAHGSRLFGLPSRLMGWNGEEAWDRVHHLNRLARWRRMEYTMIRSLFDYIGVGESSANIEPGIRKVGSPERFGVVHCNPGELCRPPQDEMWNAATHLERLQQELDQKPGEATERHLQFYSVLHNIRKAEKLQNWGDVTKPKLQNARVAVAKARSRLYDHDMRPHLPPAADAYRTTTKLSVRHGFLAAQAILLARADPEDFEPLNDVFQKKVRSTSDFPSQLDPHLGDIESDLEDHYHWHALLFLDKASVRRAASFARLSDHWVAVLNGRLLDDWQRTDGRLPPPNPVFQNSYDPFLWNDYIRRVNNSADPADHCSNDSLTDARTYAWCFPKESPNASGMWLLPRNLDEAKQGLEQAATDEQRDLYAALVQALSIDMNSGGRSDLRVRPGVPKIGVMWGTRWEQFQEAGGQLFDEVCNSRALDAAGVEGLYTKFPALQAKVERFKASAELRYHLWHFTLIQLERSGSIRCPHPSSIQPGYYPQFHQPALQLAMLPSMPDSRTARDFVVWHLGFSDDPEPEVCTGKPMVWIQSHRPFVESRAFLTDTIDGAAPCRQEGQTARRIKANTAAAASGLAQMALAELRQAKDHLLLTEHIVAQYAAGTPTTYEATAIRPHGGRSSNLQMTDLSPAERDQARAIENVVGSLIFNFFAMNHTRQTTQLSGIRAARRALGGARFSLQQAQSRYLYRHAALLQMERHGPCGLMPFEIAAGVQYYCITCHSASTGNHIAGMLRETSLAAKMSGHFTRAKRLSLPLLRSLDPVLNALLESVADRDVLHGGHRPPGDELSQESALSICLKPGKLLGEMQCGQPVFGWELPHHRINFDNDLSQARHGLSLARSPSNRRSWRRLVKLREALQAAIKQFDSSNPPMAPDEPLPGDEEPDIPVHRARDVRLAELVERVVLSQGETVPAHLAKVAKALVEVRLLRLRYFLYSVGQINQGEMYEGNSMGLDKRSALGRPPDIHQPEWTYHDPRKDAVNVVFDNKINVNNVQPSGDGRPFGEAQLEQVAAQIGEALSAKLRDIRGALSPPGSTPGDQNMFAAMRNGFLIAASLLTSGIPPNIAEAERRVRVALDGLAFANTFLSEKEIMLAAYQAEHALVEEDSSERDALGSEAGTAWTALGYDGATAGPTASHGDVTTQTSWTTTMGATRHNDLENPVTINTTETSGPVSGRSDSTAGSGASDVRSSMDCSACSTTATTSSGSPNAHLASSGTASATPTSRTATKSTAEDCARPDPAIASRVASITRSQSGPFADPDALNKSAKTVASAQREVAFGRSLSRGMRITLLYSEEQRDNLLADVKPDGQWITPRPRWTSSGRVRGTPLAERYTAALRKLQDREGLYRAATGSGLASPHGHNSALLFFITYEVVDAWDHLDAVMEEIIAAEMGWAFAGREVSDWVWPVLEKRDAGTKSGEGVGAEAESGTGHPVADEAVDPETETETNTPSTPLDGDPSPAPPAWPLPRNASELAAFSDALPSRLGEALAPVLEAVYRTGPPEGSDALRRPYPGRLHNPVRYLYGRAWERFAAGEAELGPSDGGLAHATRLVYALEMLLKRGHVPPAVVGNARRLEALVRNRYERYASVRVLLDHMAECTEGRGDAEEEDVKTTSPWIFPLGTSRD